MFPFIMTPSHTQSALDMSLTTRAVPFEVTRFYGEGLDGYYKDSDVYPALGKRSEWVEDETLHSMHWLRIDADDSWVRVTEADFLSFLWPRRKQA